MADGLEITLTDLQLPDIELDLGTDLSGGGRRVGDAKRIGDQGADGEILPLAQAKSNLEEALIREMLQRHGRNIKRAAQQLGVSRVTLYRLMGKHGIRLQQGEVD